LSKSNLRDWNFWGIIFIFLLTVHINTALYLNKFDISFMFISIEFVHLLGIISALFVVIFTPIFYVLKRRNVKLYRTLIKLHMFGNATSLLFASMHVVFRLVRRPVGIGFIMLIILMLLVLSGFTFKFNLLKPFGRYVQRTPHYNRSFHVSLTISFYLVFLIHLYNVL
jgi:hypothetical protein